MGSCSSKIEGLELPMMKQFHSNVLMAPVPQPDRPNIFRQTTVGTARQSVSQSVRQFVDPTRRPQGGACKLRSEAVALSKIAKRPLLD